MTEDLPKLTMAQRSALGSVALWSGPGGIYMPYPRAMQSFLACERRGLVEWVRVEDGHPRNGYRLTDAGRKAIAPPTGEVQP
jgi:hypothetical protein